MSAAFEDNAGALIELLNGQTDPAVETLTVVSGTAQQDQTGLISTVYLIVTGGSGGTVEIQVGPTSGVADTIVAADVATATATHSFRLPPGWFFKATIGGSAAVASCKQITG